MLLKANVEDYSNYIRDKMTGEKKRNIGQWLSNNIMLVIITALLTVLGGGGRDMVQNLRSHQDKFDSELSTYKEVQMGIIKAIEIDRKASGFWFSSIDENKAKNCEQDNKIINHEIRISALEDD